MRRFANPSDQLLEVFPRDPTDSGEANPGSNRVRQRHLRLSEGDVDRLVAGYESGSTIGELAAEFGSHKATVAGHLKHRGVQTRYRRMTEADVVEAVQLRASGWTLARIGERFGVEASTVLNRLKQR